MTEADHRHGRGRRALFVGGTFAVGVLLGAVALAGVEATGPSGARSASSATAAEPSAATPNVANTSPSYDAAAIYAKDSPGVVDIRVTEGSSSQSQGGLSPFVPGGSQQAQAEGTGFVYDRQGDIVTASHVVSGATKITVRFEDGTIAKATLVGSDPSSDTAVIRVSVPAATLTPLALGDSSTVAPGEGVLAIGSPFGYAESITAGIVSAVDRDIQAPNNFAIPNTIQTDAAINHGNSGGPLIDSSGKVVGVNVQIATDDQGGASNNAGVGFAVPSNTVKSVVDDMIAGRAVKHAYLGISVGDDPTGAGARVDSIRGGSPASKTGLRAGDVIVAANGTKVASANQLTAIVAEHQPGDMLRLTVERGGSSLDVQVTLGTRPATANA
jgi:putative serine protease PepD